MASAVLKSAFLWSCEECGQEQFIKARIGELPEDAAVMIAEHFETVDITGNGDEQESPYLVSRVVIGPAFVQCEACGKMHAASLPVED